MRVCICHRQVPVDGDRIGLRWDVHEGRRRGAGELLDRLIRHKDSALGEQIFDISKAQTEAMVSPDCIADDLVRGNDSQSNETDGLSHYQFFRFRTRDDRHAFTVDGSCLDRQQRSRSNLIGSCQNA
jgi:hypothetical protein